MIYNNKVDKISKNELEEFIMQFNASVWAEITDVLMNQASSTIQIINYEYIITSCRRTCFVEVLNYPFTAIVPVESDCNDACCRRFTRYVKINGHFEKDFQRVEEVEGSCTTTGSNCATIPFPPTDCFNRCNTLIYF